VDQLKYLDMFLHEVLRRHSPIISLVRVCTKDYKIRGRDLLIKKGQEIHIPCWAIMLDER